MEMTSYKPGTPSWVDLGSPNIDEAVAFYSGLFGWSADEGSAESGGYRTCRLGGKFVAGIGGQQQPGRPYWTTYIAVTDADAATRAITAAGGQTFVEPFDVMNFGRMAVFADPTGAAFSVWQAKDMAGAEVVNEPGAVVWNELTTREPDKAEEFYKTVFGWTTNKSDMGNFTYTQWQVDGRDVGGMMPMGDEFPADLPPHWMVYFAVADVDATAAKAGGLGGTVHVPPTDIPGIGRFAVLSDPHGAAFSVMKGNA